MAHATLDVELSDRAALALRQLVNVHGFDVQSALTAVSTLETSGETSESSLEVDVKRCVDYMFDVLGVVDAGGSALGMTSTCAHAVRVRSGECEHSRACETCGTTSELWACGACGKSFCGRYQNACAKKHASESAHDVCVSWDDMSCWCYACETYVDPSSFENVAERVESMLRARAC